MSYQEKKANKSFLPAMPLNFNISEVENKNKVLKNRFIFSPLAYNNIK